MIFDVLQPITKEILDFTETLSPEALGNKIELHTSQKTVDLETIHLAIVGVLDNTNYTNEEKVNLTNFRKQFYSLFPGNWQKNIADLGDIEAGETFNDTEFAVSKVVNVLQNKNIITLVIGGSQELTYSLYRGFNQSDKYIQVVSVDKKFDINKGGIEQIFPTYISRMIVEEPTNLYNFGVLGYQSYYVPQEEIDLFENLYFDAVRLGEIIKNIEIAEPFLRDANLVSFDLTAVKSSDSGNYMNFTPNGFTGREICALARYAGLSEKVSIIGLFQHNNSVAEAVSMAEILWYFIEGYQFRAIEDFKNESIFSKYIVPIDDFDLIFYKSNNTQRWWMDINNFLKINNNMQNIAFIPCSHQDYLIANQQEIPEKCWKALKKTI